LHVRWHNPDPTTPTDAATMQMSSQPFGVFLQDFGLIGQGPIPPIAPSSFFDVFFEVPLSALPPSAETRRPGGSLLLATGPETNPRCPPDNHWNGNVDIQWQTPKQPGQGNYHFGTVQVCPASNCSYLHIKSVGCPRP